MHGFSRRSFIKLGTIAGITISLGRVPLARAIEVHSGEQPTTWVAPDGKARYRWDAIRKVTGQKVFARDYRAQDLPGWPQEQSHAFFIKATQIDRVFEGVDLSVLGDELQPDELLYHEDLEADGIQVPKPADLGADFYGDFFLVPRGTVRSEEHTSELQSRGHLVCRLLLEKKKANKLPLLKTKAKIIRQRKQIIQDNTYQSCYLLL